MGWRPAGIYQTFFNGGNGHIKLVRAEQEDLPKYVKDMLISRFSIDHLYAAIRSQEKEGTVTYGLYVPAVEIKATEDLKVGSKKR